METYYNISPTNGINFGNGFFSNYRIILSKLIFFHENNISGLPYIDWGDTAWVEGYNPFNGDILVKKENPFNFWFEQSNPNNDDIVKTIPDFNPHDIINHSIDYFNNSTELLRQRKIDLTYLKLKQHILDKIESIYEKNLKNHITLGVIARGCEFSHYHPNYGVFGIQDFIDKIRKVLDENKQITKIFLVSEDLNYIEILKNEFPDTYHVPDVFRRTDETIEYMNRVYLWPNVDTKRPNQNELLGEETIIQTKLLGKCDYLLGMHSGVFCGALLWGENIKQIFKM